MFLDEELTHRKRKKICFFIFISFFFYKKKKIKKIKINMSDSLALSKKL